MKKLVITALALSMLVGGSAMAASVTVKSVVVATDGNFASASSSTSSSVSSNGTTSFSATGTFTGSSGKAFVLAKPSNGPVVKKHCYTSGCTASVP